MPEKGRRNKRCTRLRRAGLLVYALSFWPSFSTGLTGVLVLPVAPFFSPRVPWVNLGCVSGKQAHRYTVSTSISPKDTPAAVAYGFSLIIETFANAAPRAGPNVKATLKQAPTIAIVAPRCDSSLMSVAIAFAICTFPSLSPPTIRLARKVLKFVAATHNATLIRFPTIDHNSAVRRPCRSDSRPITGAVRACRNENREPSAPPRRTISYRESMGFENEFLYAFK